MDRSICAGSAAAFAPFVQPLTPIEASAAIVNGIALCMTTPPVAGRWGRSGLHQSRTAVWRKSIDDKRLLPLGARGVDAALRSVECKNPSSAQQPRFGEKRRRLVSLP